MDISEHPVTFFILFEIDFYEMRKKFLSDISDKIRLSYLPGTINQQNLIGFFLEEVFQKWSKFTFEHNCTC